MHARVAWHEDTRNHGDVMIRKLIRPWPYAVSFNLNKIDQSASDRLRLNCCMLHMHRCSSWSDRRLFTVAVHVGKPRDSERFPVDLQHDIMLFFTNNVD